MRPNCDLEPRLNVSIVIAAVSDDRAIDRCIESIKHVSARREVEWIVLRGDPKLVFSLRAEGMRKATGDRIAVVGDRYEVTLAWIERLWSAEMADVETGPIAAAPNLGYWGWCVYLMEYAHVAPPVAERRAHDSSRVPGGNVVYAAAVIRHNPPRASDTEWTFHARLLHAGVPVAIRPELEVRFQSPPGLREYLAERFWLSQTIGVLGGVPKLLFAPVLPLFLMNRLVVFAWKKPRLLLRFLASAPIVFVFSIIQAAGEFTGALRGILK